MRMGRDKALLEVSGQALLARQIQLTRKLGASEIFISGRPETDYSTFGCRVLLDKFTNAGPLSGIERALDATTSSLLLVLAVDLPEMNMELLQQLAGDCSETCGVIPKLASYVEPLAAFYPKATQSLALARLKRKSFAVKIFADLCVQSGLARFVDLSANETKYFANWNSPTDLPCTT